MGSSPVGGLTLGDELRALSERSGYLSSYSGGQRMKGLYQQESLKFDSGKLCMFGQACYFGAEEVVKLLVELGTAPDIETTTTAFKWSWISILVFGSQRCRTVQPADRIDGVIYGEPRHEATLRYLLSKGAPLNTQDIAGYTALHHATITMSVPHIARILLEAGADPNIQDKYGSPPLSSASLSRQIEAIEILMEFGARLDLIDADKFCMAQKYPTFGPQVAAVIHKWIRRREGKEAPLEGNGCDYCGKVAEKGIKLSFCSRCKLARYDSKECQKSHWKVHKFTCRSPDMENTLSFKPYYDSRMSKTLFNRADMINQIMGVNTKTAKDIHDDTSPKNDKPKFRAPIGPEDRGASRMVIKVQIHLGNGISLNKTFEDCLVYNKKRDFMCLLKKTDNGANYDALVRIIRENGVGGLKAYFRAELKSEDTLEIRIDNVLAEQTF